MGGRRAASAAIWLLTLAIAPISAWSAMALWFRFPGADWVRGVAAGLFVILGLVTAVALFTQRRGKATVALALAFGALIIWWGTIRPPADGDWAPDVARQTAGTLDGDILTLSDVILQFDHHQLHDGCRETDPARWRNAAVRLAAHRQRLFSAQAL